MKTQINPAKGDRLVGGRDTTGGGRRGRERSKLKIHIGKENLQKKKVDISSEDRGSEHSGGHFVGFLTKRPLSPKRILGNGGECGAVKFPTTKGSFY